VQERLRVENRIETLLFPQGIRNALHLVTRSMSTILVIAPRTVDAGVLDPGASCVP
jgi:hypothetical protein